MKKLPGIIISVLLFLCICSCILFVIVFINTLDMDVGAMIPHSLSRAKVAAGSENPVRIPDRFKPAVAMRRPIHPPPAIIPQRPLSGRH